MGASAGNWFLNPQYSKYEAKYNDLAEAAGELLKSVEKMVAWARKPDSTTLGATANDLEYDAKRVREVME